VNWRVYVGPPWGEVSARVTLAGTACATLERALAAAGRTEACGLLLGRREAERYAVEVLWVGSNASSTPETAFALDPGEVVAAHDGATTLGLEVLGAWHSHPSGDLTPSARDRAEAWPGQLLLIAANLPL